MPLTYWQIAGERLLHRFAKDVEGVVVSINDVRTRPRTHTDTDTHTAVHAGSTVP